MQQHMEQLPDTTNFPGNFNFELSLGPHTDSATKSADYTFSPALGKLYVQKGAQCPFKWKTTHAPPPNTTIKILPVYKGSHVLSEPVRRCSNHAENEKEGTIFSIIVRDEEYVLTIIFFDLSEKQFQDCFILHSKLI